MTVPPLSASLDVAPQPSPMIQLPLQLPLANIVDLNSIHPNESNKLDQEREIDTIKAKDDETDQEIIPMRRPCSKKRQTKCVRFADDCGRCLETVRVMTEPSDYPPKISPAVLKRYRRAAALAARKDGQQLIGHAVDDDSDELDSDDCDRGPRSTWKLGFKQPASEYVKFRETLDHQKVALENVMLKNEQCRMVGTIKVSSKKENRDIIPYFTSLQVANIAFEKVVFVRYSADKWRTFVDKLAQYQSSPSKTFDTFRFDIEIPRNEGKASHF
jgi:protein phosphatase 1 regulatory subunit 3A/B/C/D/E